MVGKADQDRLVPVGEGPIGAVGDVEEPLDLPADPDRHHEGGDDAFPPGRLRVVVAHPRIVGAVRGAEGPARAPRLAPRAAAARDARRVRFVHRVAHAVAGEHRVGLGIPEQDVGDVAPAQLPGGRRHPAQDRGGIEGGGDGAHQPGQGLGLDPAPLGVRVEPRVLERYRRLVREGLGQAHVVLGEDPAAHVHQAERADHLLLHDERHREDGADLRVLEERAHVGGEAQPRVGEDVVGDHRPPLGDRQPDRSGAARVPQRPVAQGRPPRAGRFLQGARLGIEAEDRSREHADQIPHAVHHPLGDAARM